MYPTLYKVEYWDDIDQKTIIARGLIYADTARDAVAQIEDWYGEDTINSVEVHLLEHQLIEISEEQFQSLLANR